MDKNAVEQNMMIRTCPVCHHSSAKKIFWRDFSGMGAIVPFSYYDVMECEHCGAYYADHLRESIPLVQYYAQMSKYETKEFELSKASLEDHDVAVSFLMGHLVPETSVLDIGCGNGTLLYMLKKSGVHYVTGLEPSEKNCRAIEERWGIRAVSGVLGGTIAALTDEKFDIVVMKGVLEHLLDVKESVKHALEYTAAKGKLYIIVPTVSAFPHYPDLYQQFSVEHVNFFSLQTLSSLMGTFGMTCTAHRINGDALYSLWQKNDTAVCDIHFDTEGAHSMHEYLASAEDLRKRIARRLTPLKGRRIYIWAAGTHTAMLYQLRLLDDVRVEAIVDSNVNYQGNLIYGVPIIAPEALKERENLPIVVSSQNAQEAIRRQIVETMQLSNEVVTLY